MLGALDNQTSARLVPLQNLISAATPHTSRTTFTFNNRPDAQRRAALGVRARTDRSRQIGSRSRLDLTQPIPEMQATPPAMPAQARQLMASEELRSYILQRRVELHERQQPARVAQHAVELPAAVRREPEARRQFRAAIRLRTLPDAHEQRARHAGRLRRTSTPASRRRRTRSVSPTVSPRQNACGSVPVARQSGDRAVRAVARALHEPRRRREPRRA